MSKPTLVSVSFSIGFYRNDRVRNLRESLLKTIKKPVEFGELGPMLFQIVMAWAGENQMDGNLSNVSDIRWHEIFLTNNVQVTLDQAVMIKNAMEAVGLLDGGKIRSWGKFNRHLADYEKIKKTKVKAALFMHKKREADAKASAKAAAHSPAPSPAPVKASNGHGAKPVNPVSRVISMEKVLAAHPGRDDAANASSDANKRKLDRAEFRALSKKRDELNREIAAGPNPVAE